MFCLSIHQVMDIWVISTFGLLWTMRLWTICVQVFSWMYVFYSLGYKSRSGSGHEVSLCLTFWGTTVLQSSSIILYSYPQYKVQGFWFLHILTDACNYIFFIKAIPVGVKCYLIVVLTCISLMTNDVEHHLCIYWSSVYLLWSNVYLNPKPIF